MRGFPDAVKSLVSQLDASNVGYCLLGASALFVQGVSATAPGRLEVSVQWDAIERVYEGFSAADRGGFHQDSDVGVFETVVHDFPVEVRCFYNTVVVTDPYRIAVQFGDHSVWVKSLYYYQQNVDRCTDAERAAIQGYLRELQRTNAAVNREAWNQNTYDAWVNRHGTPTEAAQKIAKHPVARLQPLAHYMGDLQGKRVMHMLGSHGGKAVAMALLGAKVSVVDISATNQRYALDVAREAGVDIDYVVSDVLALPDSAVLSDYDLVLLELGVLHYFVDLGPLFLVVHDLLSQSGRFILHEFHPVSTKLITSTGRKHKVTGNYFDFSMETRAVAHSKYGGDGEHPLVRLRKWSLGEIITSVATAGLRIVRLDEEPNHKIDDIGIPKTFTLVAEKNERMGAG